MPEVWATVEVAAALVGTQTDGFTPRESGTGDAVGIPPHHGTQMTGVADILPGGVISPTPHGKDSRICPATED